MHFKNKNKNKDKTSFSTCPKCACSLYARVRFNNITHYVIRVIMIALCFIPLVIYSDTIVRLCAQILDADVAILTCCHFRVSRSFSVFPASRTLSTSLSCLCLAVSSSHSLDTMSSRSPLLRLVMWREIPRCMRRRDCFPLSMNRLTSN